MGHSGTDLAGAGRSGGNGLAETSRGRMESGGDRTPGPLKPSKRPQGQDT